MKKDKLFKRYYGRMRLEGLLKSLVWGIAVGFAIGALFAFFTLGFNSFANVFGHERAGLFVFLIALGIWVGVTLISMPLFYLFRFRPDASRTAERIDRTGLEERLVTMKGLEGDDSYIAELQREDAKAKLTTVPPKKVKIKAFMLVPTIIAAALMVVFAASILLANMTIDTPMAWNSYQREPEVVEVAPEDPEFEFFWIEYLVMGGGFIDGDVFQVVFKGENGRQVRATAVPGFAFAQWSFEHREQFRYNPNRQELDVRRNIVHMAEFYPEAEEPGDDSDYNEEPDDPQDDDEPTEHDPDVVIDGGTNHRDIPDTSDFANWLAEALAILAAGGEIPLSLRLMIEAYFAMIAS